MESQLEGVWCGLWMSVLLAAARPSTSIDACHVDIVDIPSKAVLFDQRVKVTADFGAHPWNFISFNPQARLVALAGFGNLAGKIDIFDRRTLNKVCSINAPNTSHCEWSPDGRNLLTATLSPRLRVDNGIKVWHCTGPLLHVHMVDELYQVIASFPGRLFDNSDMRFIFCRLHGSAG